MEALLSKLWISRIRFFSAQGYDKAGRVAIRLEILLILLFLWRVPFIFYSWYSLVFSILVMGFTITGFVGATRRSILLLTFTILVLAICVVLQLVGTAVVVYFLSDRDPNYNLYIGIIACSAQFICLIIIPFCIVHAFKMRQLLKKLKHLPSESMRNYAATRLYTPGNRQPLPTVRINDAESAHDNAASPVDEQSDPPIASSVSAPPKFYDEIASDAMHRHHIINEGPVEVRLSTEDELCLSHSYSKLPMVNEHPLRHSALANSHSILHSGHALDRDDDPPRTITFDYDDIPSGSDDDDDIEAEVVTVNVGT